MVLACYIAGDRAVATITSMNQVEVKALATLIGLAKREDLGAGDITSALLLDPSRPSRFELQAREPCVFCGQEVAEQVLQSYDAGIQIFWADGICDGSRVSGGGELATISGPLGSILAAERVMLNFVQRLCGVATRTRQFVDAVTGTGARIYDTRKTTPGWRALEKYAVRCGGGHNHRSGLYDAVLIKDNHLADIEPSRLAYHVFDLLGRLPADPAQARPFVQVEATSLEQLEELFKVVGIDSILLDNFALEELREAVSLRERLGLGEKIVFEASGGITLERVREVAETGVERISVGSLTHSARAIDLALERV